MPEKNAHPVRASRQFTSAQSELPAHLCVRLLAKSLFRLNATILGNDDEYWQKTRSIVITLQFDFSTVNMTFFQPIAERSGVREGQLERPQ